MIPYGRHSIDNDDIQAVVEVLKSDFLTTGLKIGEFEKAVAEYVGAKHAISVSSGTAALHCAIYALGIGPGDEVIVPPITFAATANCVVYQGGTPVFADVKSDTLLIDPAEVEKKVTPKTKAIIGVDYAGQPCDWDSLREIANKYNLFLIADGCHALGAEYKGRRVGTLADLTVFSFHPVKHITTGEGGMIVTDNMEYAKRMRTFRNHGITTDHRQRAEQGSWFYEMTDLGYNYRITDFQCALGTSQLKKLPQWITVRREIASQYNMGFKNNALINPLKFNKNINHAYHLYVVRIAFDKLNVNRQTLFGQLRANGIGINVHYIPVYLHPYYQKVLNFDPGLCPNAETAYKEILSLPIFPQMNRDAVAQIIKTITSMIESVVL